MSGGVALARIRRVAGADRWCTWRRGRAYPGAFGAVIPIAAGIGAWIAGRYNTSPYGLLTGLAVGFGSFALRQARPGRRLWELAEDGDA